VYNNVDSLRIDSIVSVTDALNRMLILFVFIVVSSLWIGWISRDRYIRRQIGNATERAIGNNLFLSGDSINYIRCISILDITDIDKIAEELQNDSWTDDTLIPLPIKRCIYSLLTCITQLYLLREKVL